VGGAVRDTDAVLLHVDPSLPGPVADGLDQVVGVGPAHVLEGVLGCLVEDRLGGRPEVLRRERPGNGNPKLSDAASGASIARQAP